MNTKYTTLHDVNSVPEYLNMCTHYIDKFDIKGVP